MTREIDADETVRYGPGPRHFGELRLPPDAGPHPVVVLVHGGCWRNIADLHYMDRLAAELTGIGWATWNLAFRRLGDPGGGWPGTFRDVSSGIDHLRELTSRHPLDPGRAVTLGHSSGGHLALWGAARARVSPDSELHASDPLELRGAVSLGGIADPEAFHAMDPSRRACDDGVVELLGGEPAAVPGRAAAASPARLLPLGVPQLLVTGADDPDVPPSHVEEYASRARAAGDTVAHHVVPDAGHFDVVRPRSSGWAGVRAPLVEFLERIAGG